MAKTTTATGMSTRTPSIVERSIQTQTATGTGEPTAAIYPVPSRKGRSKRQATVMTMTITAVQAKPKHAMDTTKTATVPSITVHQTVNVPREITGPIATCSATVRCSGRMPVIGVMSEITPW